MKKNIITLCLVGSLLIILSSFHFGDALTLFLLAGVIPGTNILITPAQTIGLYALLGGFILSRVIMPPIIRHTRASQSQKA